MWIVSLLIERGWSERAAKAAAIAACLAVLLLVACLLYFGLRSAAHDYKEAAIETHEADLTAEAANRVLEADRAATANQVSVDQILANHQEELRDEARDKGDGSSVGPGVSAVLAKLRDQQRAR